MAVSYAAHRPAPRLRSRVAPGVVERVITCPPRRALEQLIELRSPRRAAECGIRLVYSLHYAPWNIYDHIGQRQNSAPKNTLHSAHGLSSLTALCCMHLCNQRPWCPMQTGFMFFMFHYLDIAYNSPLAVYQ
jgi:hypothetical protein